jgi:outer membrane protein insertion porin family
MSQATDSTQVITPVVVADTVQLIRQNVDTIPESELPEIYYTNTPRKYKIQDIKVVGAPNYEDYVLITSSGLAVGDEIAVPGDEITEAMKRFWRQGLFSNIRILTPKKDEQERKIWLEIHLTPRPRIGEIHYNGVKKNERSDLETKLNLKPGHQITPHIVDRAKILIKKYFDDKGFRNVDVDVVEKPMPNKEDEVLVNINIDKNEKTKIQQIYFNGNEQLSEYQLRRAMKKTNERFSMLKRFRNSWLEFFSTKKYTSAEYENDKNNLIDKYNEYGYRDAVIVADSITPYNKKRVNIYLSIEEGQQYYLKDVRFVGNTKFLTDDLARVLNMKSGDVYNQKKLIERMYQDEDAVQNVYMNEGYLFAHADPVEIDVTGDSVTLEIRIFEGQQATINKVVINGNDRLYEDVVRRELRTRPGDLYSRAEVMRSLRELAQMGHFDPENIIPEPIPNEENGTVDIIYNLTSKANDQIDFSLGWGQTGLIGKVGLKFTNFAIGNILKSSTYKKGIVPSGEGQTLNLSGQTNARYYQAYSVSFMDPWFGGKRPNLLSVSAYFSRYTGVNSRYYNQMQQQYLTNYYNNYNYGGYGGYGYGDYYGGGSSYENAYDKSKYMQILGLSVGFGKRLSWPDDFFQLMTTLNYQMYMLHNWENSYYLNVSENGNYNDINLELSLQRNSIDNPLYTRRGSQFTLSASTTLPYSKFDGRDYSTITSDAKKYRFVEYYKIKFQGKVYIPLAAPGRTDEGKSTRTPVLMSRVETAWIGDYDKNKKSPFGTYYVGGDGMTGGYSYYQETVALRGYENGEIAGNNIAMPFARAYSRMSLEFRYPLILEPSSTIYALVFAEAGDAWNSIKDFKPFNLKRSAGGGVRIYLPMIGMMGIDWAYGFDKPYGSTNRGGSNFHFILGQEF